MELDKKVVNLNALVLNIIHAPICIVAFFFTYHSPHIVHQRRCELSSCVNSHLGQITSDVKSLHLIYPYLDLSITYRYIILILISRGNLPFYLIYVYKSIRNNYISLQPNVMVSLMPTKQIEKKYKFKLD